VSHKLWQRKLRDGAQVSAALEYDAGVGAVITLTVASAHAEDTLALGLADAVRKLIERDGAVPLKEDDGPKAA
jgi:hypothetical protein